MTDLLRIAAWLFFAQGAFHFAIGALTPVFIDHNGGSLFFTRRSDSGYFGGDTKEMQERDPNLTKLRSLIVIALAGLLVALGAAIMAIAWFAVRPGHVWGYWSLVVAGAVALPYWIATVGRYVSAGADIGLGDVPPFMWLTSLLWAVGTGIGAFGLRS